MRYRWQLSLDTSSFTVYHTDVLYTILVGQNGMNYVRFINIQINVLEWGNFVAAPARIGAVRACYDPSREPTGWLSPAHLSSCSHIHVILCQNVVKIVISNYHCKLRFYAFLALWHKKSITRQLTLVYYTFTSVYGHLGTSYTCY